MKKKSKKFLSSTFLKVNKCYFIIALVSFGIYFNTLFNDFVFDDEQVILNDPSIITISNIPKYFIGTEGFHKTIARYYRPVISTSYAMDYAVWNYNPLGFHLTNVLINIINSLLFFKFLLLIFNKDSNLKKSKNELITPLLVAIIFSIHPIHTEAIAWISGRTDSIAFTFFIASFIFYLKYSEEENTKQNNLNFTLICFFYIISLFSKEMAITLPLIIIVYDIIVERLSWTQIKKQKIKIYFTLLILSILFLIIRGIILKNVPEQVNYYYFHGKDFATTFYTIVSTIPLYVRLLVFPVGLLYHYNGYLPYIYSFLNTGVIFAFIIILILIVTAIYFFKKKPLISFSIVLFFVTLLPVLNIIPTINLIAERFLYIPSISLCLILLIIFNLPWFRKHKLTLMNVSIMIIVLFSILTIRRNMDWKTNDSLFLSAEGKPGTAVYVNLGNIYVRKQSFDTAEQYFRKAIELKDETPLAYNNLAKLLMVRGKYDSAYLLLNKAINYDTLSPEPHLTLARLYKDKYMTSQAINEIEKIHKIIPSYMDSETLLAELKGILKKDSLNPNITQTKINPDVIIQKEQDARKKFQNGDYMAAILMLNDLIQLNPASKATYYNNLGMSYLKMNKYDEAEKNFTHAIEAENNFSAAYNNLGTVYEKQGLVKLAKDNYKKAMEIDPGNVSAKNNYERVK